MPPFRDLLIWGLSTQLHQQATGFDDLISADDEDYASSGLVAPSLIRLGFLASVPTDRIMGRIGAISSERHARLVEKLCEYLTRES
jgi:mRNA interferase MazF